ncbi:MAG TPA: hypothetical protein VN376_03380 [Longilinea sp.]|nr:hypothetical protein [Longilinea sp.]
MAEHHQNLRKFNRSVFNPIIKLFAGRFIYALVQHTGRTSGKEYTTPVVAAIKEGTIFIPLPYGADTDWFLNVQAKGGCMVTLRGKQYAAATPIMVDPAAALPAFSQLLRRAFKRAEISQFLRLSVV